MTPLGVEPATFRLVELWLSQLRHLCYSTAFRQSGGQSWGIYRVVEQASLLSGTVSPCPVLTAVVVRTVVTLPSTLSRWPSRF